jgi:hypothetical protein
MRLFEKIICASQSFGGRLLLLLLLMVVAVYMGKLFLPAGLARVSNNTALSAYSERKEKCQLND